MLKKKIALLIGQGDASYQRTLIRGVTKELLSSKYELHIFTNFHTTDLHTDVDPSQISGETSIFHMVPWDEFQGILIAPSTLQYTGKMNATPYKRKSFLILRDLLFLWITKATILIPLC